MDLSFSSTHKKDNKCNSEFSGSPTHIHKKMGISEKSKTFTIESLLKSDEIKRDSKSPSDSPSAVPSDKVNKSQVRLSLKPEEILDFSRQTDPQILNWIRMQNPRHTTDYPPTHASVAAPLQTHYLLSTLSGSKTIAQTPSSSTHPALKRSRKPGVDRKPRQAYSAKQLEKLETEFKLDKYLSVNKRMELSKGLNLTEIQIKTWFQNRRTKWKKQLTSRLKIAQRQGMGMYANAYLQQMFPNPAIQHMPAIHGYPSVIHHSMTTDPHQLTYMLNNEQFLRTIVHQQNQHNSQFNHHHHQQHLEMLQRSSVSPGAVSESSATSSEISINLNS